jgi:hypothetical protein
MKVLRDAGYIVGKTEHWNGFAKPHGIRQDLFGFIDCLAIPPFPRQERLIGQVCSILAVQCVNTHLQEHIFKIRENEAAQRWLALGQKIVIHHWRKRSENKKLYWDLEVINFEP